MGGPVLWRAYTPPGDPPAIGPRGARRTWQQPGHGVDAVGDAVDLGYQDGIPVPHAWPPAILDRRRTERVGQGTLSHA